MPEITRERVIYRGGDDDSDDDRSSFSRREGSGSGYRTVQRYRVTPSRVEPVEDERRTSRTTLEVGRRGDRLEVDRTSDRFVAPERPRSAIDIRPRSTIVERYVEREPIREPERDRERTRTVFYERDRRESDRPWERESGRSWEPERDVRETDVRIEKRVTEERREPPYEVERYQRETEYYERPEPPAPIVIRQRAPEPQQIIVQEAPAPPPIYLPQPAREEAFQVVRRESREVERPEPRRTEDEYYYRRDVREVGDRRRSHEDLALGAAAVAAPLAVAAYHRKEREIRPRDSVSDEEGSEGSDYVVKRRIIKKERSRSRSPHHKRHLAEGALAGAGAAALIANHRDKQGNGPQHRGRQVAGGAALGALGAEVLTRARSRYRESHDEERSRSRSSSRHSHRKIKTALGLAAAGLAAAAAAKYVSNRRANNEEIGRGRSRTRSVSRRRYSDDDDYDDYDDDRTRSRSRHADPKHRASQMAKAGAATAAVAGVVEHFRNKSRKRSGSRSKSRIRTGAEIAASGLAGAAVAGLYENRKAKEDREVEAVAESRRERRRSRSRARSVGVYSDPGVDPELGMVQYGTEPVNTAPNYYDPALVAGAGAAYGATREHRSRSGRHRYSSGSSPDHEQRRRSRSRSRVRDIAGAAAGTAAAAIGINQYKKRKEKKEAERERERRRFEEEESSTRNYFDHNYHDEDYSPSPPHASGGSYYPENNQFPPPSTGGFTQQPLNTQVPPANAGPIPPYNPADYAAQGQQPLYHDPYGYPPGTGDNVSANERSRPPTVVNVPSSAAAATMSGAVPYFPPPPTAPLEDEHVSHDHDHNRDPLERAEEARVNNIYTPPSTASPSPTSSPTPHNKSVNFAPLSPTSSRRLAKIHKHSTHTHAPYDSSDPANLPPSESSNYNRQFSSPDADDEEETDHVYDTPSSPEHHHRRRRRRSSDPSSDRPNQPSKHRRRNHNASRSPSPNSTDEVEVLPDRFDRDGRPLDRHGNPYSNSRSRGTGVGGGGGGGGGQEMVEKFTRDFGDIIEGRKSWKDMLRTLVEAGGAGSPTGSDSGRRRR